jgi:hypothetical protein
MTETYLACGARHRAASKSLVTVTDSAVIDIELMSDIVMTGSINSLHSLSVTKDVLRGAKS